MTREHCPWYWLFINGVWRAELWVLLLCIYICNFANWARFQTLWQKTRNWLFADQANDNIAKLVQAADLMHMNSLLILFWLKSNLGLKNSFCPSIEISLPALVCDRENAFFHATSQPSWAKHHTQTESEPNQIEQLPVCGVLYLIVYRQQSTLSSYIQLYKPWCTRLPKAVDARNNSLLSRFPRWMWVWMCDIISSCGMWCHKGWCSSDLCAKSDMWMWCHIQMFRFM